MYSEYYFFDQPSLPINRASREGLHRADKLHGFGTSCHIRPASGGPRIGLVQPEVVHVEHGFG